MGCSFSRARVMTPSVPSLPQISPLRSRSSSATPASICFSTRSRPYPALRRIVFGNRARIRSAYSRQIARDAAREAQRDVAACGPPPASSQHRSPPGRTISTAARFSLVRPYLIEREPAALFPMHPPIAQCAAVAGSGAKNKSGRVLREHAVEFVDADARFDEARAIGDVDLVDLAVERREVDDDRAVRALPRERRPAATRQHGHATARRRISSSASTSAMSRGVTTPSGFT